MSRSFSKSTWNNAAKVQGEEISERGFISITSFFTMIALFFSAYVATQTMHWEFDFLSFLLVGLGVPIVGIIIAAKSKSVVGGLIGLSMIAFGLGAITGPVLALYKLNVIMKALTATAATTAVTSIIGITYPKSLSHWGSYLFVGLISLICVRLAQMALMYFFNVPATEGWWILVEYGGALLFSLFIIYDWNRGLEMGREHGFTAHGAVMVAVALFLDIANLFLHLLRIFGVAGDD